MDKYDSLDGLRAWATIGILLTHLQANMSLSLPDVAFFNRIIPSCSNLVFLFMILSAFSMCCGYYQKFKDKQIDLNVFYKKRYSRIWPFFALLVCIDFFASPSVSSFYELFADLTLFFGFLPNAGIEVIGVGWFLGIIFAFYTIFPFFIFLIDNKRRAWIVLLLALIFNYLASTYFSRPELVVKPVDKFNLLYCMPTFLIGGLLFLYAKRFACWIKLKYVCLLVAVGATVVFYATNQVRFIPIVIMYTVWILYAIIDSRTSAKMTFLRNHFTAYISSISMEIYICHMAVFRIVEKIHLNSVSQSDLCNYVMVSVLTLFGAIIFSHMIKFIVFPKISLILGKLFNFAK